jgi:biopolymer transport protein ExbD
MAGGALDDSGDEEISGINVTPLVDIMLVLLIVFMVTATFIANKAIEMKLPEAESAASQRPDEKTISFAIDKAGQLWMNDSKISFDEVETKIRQERALKSNVNLAANISADGKTPYELVVKLIDIVRKNEIIDFAITTDPVAVSNP